MGPDAESEGPARNVFPAANGRPPSAASIKIGAMNDREVFESTLQRAADALHLPLQDHHLARLWRHFNLVVEANRSFNLTRITDPADAALKHFADSLTLLATPWVRRDVSLTLLDVGTGAGFPAVPLAVVCESWRITAIDGTGKKARFVAEAAADLGLVNLAARHIRAADLARQAGGRTSRSPVRQEPGEQFDLIVMRAVTQIAKGIEEVRSLLAPAGAVVFYKSGDLSDEELTAGTAQARRRGLTEVSIHTLQLPAPAGPLERRLVRYARQP